MRYSIDARYVRDRPSGIGAYVQALIDRLPALAPNDRMHLWRAPTAPQPLSSHPSVDETCVRAPANSLRTLARAGRLVDLADVDVLHAPFNLLGRGVGCASVVTVHDVMWLLRPDLCEGARWLAPLQARFYRDGILRALNRATRIVAISEATAWSIHLVAPACRARVRVIHHGVEPRFVPGEATEDAPYFLVLGQNSPSKNHGAVLDAFAAADVAANTRLVLLQRLYQRGRFGLSVRPELYRRAQRLGIEGRIDWRSHLDDDDVVRLLQGALALVQFSRFEGFGMPALEALACGTPVIASDIAPLLEVCGGAAVHVPLDPAALADAMGRVARSASLRTELRDAGLARVRDFSWDRSARAHLEVYREAAATGALR